jgi:hypothetical protein
LRLFEQHMVRMRETNRQSFVKEAFLAKR